TGSRDERSRDGQAQRSVHPDRARPRPPVGVGTGAGTGPRTRGLLGRGPGDPGRDRAPPRAPGRPADRRIRRRRAGGLPLAAPHLRYSFDHFTGYDEPAIRIHAVKDTDGTPFLLLSGLEPDLRWDRFTESVIDLCEAFGVRMSVGLGAMPLAVPHTRPTHSSAHASDVDLIRGFTAWPGEFAVPGNAGSLLELRMSEHGIPSAGFTVHVPQYLAQTTYPAAVLDLVGNVAEIADLQLPTGSLESAAASFTEQVDSQIADSPEVLNAVEMMEKQFDQFMESRHGSDSLNPGGKPLPSGDEIGAEFERFLAEQSDDEGPSAG